jgi:hypothetical protein
VYFVLSRSLARSPSRALSLPLSPSLALFLLLFPSLSLSPSLSPSLSGILGPETYSNLSQCETLDDLKMNLQTNEGYAGFLQNEPSPISTMTVRTYISLPIVTHTHLISLYIYAQRENEPFAYPHHDFKPLSLSPYTHTYTLSPP